MHRVDDEHKDRDHPHRLHADMYRMPDQVIFVLMCAKGDIHLSAQAPAADIAAVAARIGRIHHVSIHAYCIMPDHAHFVISVAEEGGDIAKWVRYTKRETARGLGATGMRERSYWDRHARQPEDVIGMVEYTLNNPVRAGLCDTFDQWPYSWSQWHSETRRPAPDGTED